MTVVIQTRPNHHTHPTGSRVDDYCLCTPSLAIDTVLEYHETKDGPATGLVFIKRKDGRGLAAVGGFCEIGACVSACVRALLFL